MSTIKFVLITLLFTTASLTFASDNKEEKKNDSSDDGVQKKEITYDGRSLIINGKRELLFSGSVHYTRSPPEVPSSSSSMQKLCFCMHRMWSPWISM